MFFVRLLCLPFIRSNSRWWIEYGPGFGFRFRMAHKHALAVTFFCSVAKGKKEDGKWDEAKKALTESLINYLFSATIGTNKERNERDPKLSNIDLLRVQTGNYVRNETNLNVLSLFYSSSSLSLAWFLGLRPFVSQCNTTYPNIPVLCLSGSGLCDEVLVTEKRKRQIEPKGTWLGI